MGDVLAFKRKTAAQKHKGKTLCQSGFHKWVIDKTRVFDSQKGRLVTQYCCARCDARKTVAL